ncbi:MAG: TonB C-terminal domain-containing protein [Gemmatimonadetes bacterium]|nr:TonB C-terminal domain-containing protein [Gemmatimonadota bacterium]
MRDAYGRRTRPGVTSGIIWTGVVHVVGAVVLMAAARPQEIAPPVYAVELVAAPRTPPKPRRAPEATPRQVDPPPEASPKPQARKDDPPAPVPVPVKQETEPPPKTAPTEQPLPDETPKTGTAPVNVEIPGLMFPYPQYLQNIVAQVYRRWDRPRTNASLRAEVFFTIQRDGSVNDIRFIRRSGNFTFDLGAQGAVEAAANAGAFGPLPDGFREDILPVSFFFTPRGS